MLIYKKAVYRRKLATIGRNSSSLLRIPITPNQYNLLQEIMDYEDYTMEPVYRIENVVLRKTYADGPVEFWEDVVLYLEESQDERAESTAQNCDKYWDDRCYDFAYNRVINSFEVFRAKIKKALKNREEELNPPPSPPEVINKPVIVSPPPPSLSSTELQRPELHRVNDNITFIGIDPTGIEWNYYKDSARVTLDFTVDMFMKHWHRWMKKQSTEGLQKILENPRGVVEQQFADLMKG